MVNYAEQPDPPRELPAGDSPPWRFAEAVAGSLFTPSRTLREIGQREAILPAMLLVMLLVGVSVSGQLAAAFGTWGQRSELDPPQELLAVQVTGILWNLVWGPVAWTIAAGLLFGVAWMLGGRGRFTALWAASGFALVPLFLAAPLQPMMELSALLGTGWQLAALIVSIPIYLIAFVWTLVLLAIAARETMGISGGRAMGSVGILVGGCLILAVLAACVIVLLIWGLFVAAA